MNFEKIGMMKWLKEGLCLKLRISYQKPKRLTTAEHEAMWFDTWAEAITSMTTDRELVERAWSLLVKRYARGTDWPPVGMLCGIISELMPDKPRGSQRGSKSAFGCASFIAENMGHAIDEWWMFNSAWFDEQCVVHGIAPERKDLMRAWVGYIVKDGAHYHCQCLYWGNKAPPFDLSSPGFEPYALRLEHVWKLKPFEKAA